MKDARGWYLRDAVYDGRGLSFAKTRVMAAPPCRRYNRHPERQVSLSSGARLGPYKIVAETHSFIADVDKKK